MQLNTTTAMGLMMRTMEVETGGASMQPHMAQLIMTTAIAIMIDIMVIMAIAGDMIDSIIMIDIMVIAMIEKNMINKIII